MWRPAFLLWRLRQCIELTLVHSRWNKIVSCTFWCGFIKNRCLDIYKTFRFKKVSDWFCHTTSEYQSFLHLVFSQIFCRMDRQWGSWLLTQVYTTSTSISPVSIFLLIDSRILTIPSIAMTNSPFKLFALLNVSSEISVSNTIWTIPLLSRKSVNINPPKFLFFCTV